MERLLQLYLFSKVKGLETFLRGMESYDGIFSLLRLRALKPSLEGWKGVLLPRTRIRAGSTLKPSLEGWKDAHISPFAPELSCLETFLRGMESSARSCPRRARLRPLKPSLEGWKAWPG